jgi:hypothetical protein
VGRHPSRKYAVSVSDDASWAWWDLNNAACLKQVSGSGLCTVALLNCVVTGACMLGICSIDDASWAWWDLNSAACLKQVRGSWTLCIGAGCVLEGFASHACV